MYLEIIPNAISRFEHIEILDLSWNKIKALPQALSRFKNLQTITLEGNGFSKLDFTELCDIFSVLESLPKGCNVNLSGTEIRKCWPSEFWWLKEIKNRLDSKGINYSL